jgi:hypothetical protein
MNSLLLFWYLPYVRACFFDCKTIVTPAAGMEKKNRLAGLGRLRAGVLGRSTGTDHARQGGVALDIETMLVRRVRHPRI